MVWRHWLRESDLDPELDSEQPPKMETLIYGKGICEKDSVRVIGSKDTVKEFDLTIKTDEDAKAEWEFLKEADDAITAANEEGSPQMRLKRGIREKLDKAPPTAVLYVTEGDWETAVKGGWSIQCMLPKDVFDQLESELIMQRVQQVLIGIKWTIGLVYASEAPPSIPNIWGLFKTSEDSDPEPLYGHVESFGWGISQNAPSDEETHSRKNGPGKT